MLKNAHINRAVTRKIATALGDLNAEVVYVGGAVISLYIDDISADDVRPTKDLDLMMEILSLGQLEALRENLVKLGFKQTADDSVVCRFRYDDILVDVMATKPIAWAPGNRWFGLGFNQSFKYNLDDLSIRLLPLPYFLATKFDAFFDRGNEDVYVSHDFEDIVYLFNHISDIVQKIEKSEKKVKEYLMDCSNKILQNSQLLEAIKGNLFHEAQDQRFSLIISRLKKIAVSN
jgi:predicted nucleotidyltransferase